MVGGWGGGEGLWLSSVIVKVLYNHDKPIKEISYYCTKGDSSPFWN